LRVLTISCGLLLGAAVAQEAGAQQTEQSAQRRIEAEAVALSRVKKVKGKASGTAAASRPSRVILNTTPTENVRAPDGARAPWQAPAKKVAPRAERRAGGPVVAPSDIRKRAKSRPSSP
jgi:hypothetical protein